MSTCVSFEPIVLRNTFCTTSATFGHETKRQLKKKKWCNIIKQLTILLFDMRVFRMSLHPTKSGKQGPESNSNMYAHFKEILLFI